MENCIRLLRELNFPNYNFEVDSVFDITNKLRMFWKPENVRIILLAESHVYTQENEVNQITQNLANFPQGYDLANYPQEYVRLIYSLGYGESSLLENNPNPFNNAGTWQFWKIFYYCLNSFALNPVANVIGGETQQRITNKLNLLFQMREQGIWLLDASLIGFYDPAGLNNLTPLERTQILGICWDNYIGNLINQSNPERIIVIGQGVGNALQQRLQATDINYHVVNQPQAHMNREQLASYHQSFFDLCDPILNPKN